MYKKIKKFLLIVTVLFFGVIPLIEVIMYDTEIAFAKKNIEMQLFDKAEINLLNAAKYRDLEKDEQNLYDYVILAKKSLLLFDEAEKNYQNGDFLGAATSYALVSSRDVERYEVAIQKQEEIMEQYLAENAKKELSDLEKEGKYKEAAALMNLISILTNIQNEDFYAKQKYYKSKVKEIEAVEKAKEEEKLKAEREKEDAIKQREIDELYSYKWTEDYFTQKIYRKHMRKGTYKMIIDYKGSSYWHVHGLKTKNDHFDTLSANGFGPERVTVTFRITSEQSYDFKFYTQDGTDFGFKIEGVSN